MALCRAAGVASCAACRADDGALYGRGARACAQAMMEAADKPAERLRSIQMFVPCPVRLSKTQACLIRTSPMIHGRLLCVVEARCRAYLPARKTTAGSSATVRNNASGRGVQRVPQRACRLSLRRRSTFKAGGSVFCKRQDARQYGNAIVGIRW